MSDNVLENVLILIKEQNMTEKECLLKCNINTSFFTDWKNGKIKYPSYDKIIKLADCLGVSVQHILFGNDTKMLQDEKEHELLKGFRQLDNCEKNIIIGKVFEFIYNKSQK